MYRTLDTEKTIATLKTLANRIDERFPDSGLRKVCHELVSLAAETRGRIEWMSRPNAVIRVCIFLMLVLSGLAAWYTVDHIRVRETTFDIDDFITMFEAGCNALVVLGAALFFLLTVESRIKRQRALAALHELRAMSHVIDMHQLTKDPSQVLSHAGPRTRSSPQRSLTAFQLTRYLDYCSEMLSLLGKLAALYAQRNPDQVVLQAVNDIEALTDGLSRKIWQKIMILDDDLQRDQLHAEREAAKASAKPEDASHVAATVIRESAAVPDYTNATIASSWSTLREEPGQNVRGTPGSS